jgi:hypothetical protein
LFRLRMLPNHQLSPDRLQSVWCLPSLTFSFD